MEWIGLDP